MCRHLTRLFILSLTLAAYQGKDSAAYGQDGFGCAGCRLGRIDPPRGFGLGCPGDEEAKPSQCEAFFHSDLIIIGKVTSISGTKDDAGKRFAFVKITVILQGPKGLKEIKVQLSADEAEEGEIDEDFVGPPEPKEDESTDAELQRGMVAVFHLSPGSEENCYAQVIPAVDSEDSNYKETVEKVRKIVRIFKDPLTALKSGFQEDRFHAAMTLIAKYRRAMGDKVDQVDIPLRENKKILEILAEADWMEREELTELTVVDAVVLLGLPLEANLEEEEVEVESGNEFERNMSSYEKMKKKYEEWLKGDGAKYVIKKIVQNVLGVFGVVWF